eukprot:scaffold98632_cov20-Tisochrysis_lutea.AAC.3
MQGPVHGVVQQPQQGMLPMQQRVRDGLLHYIGAFEFVLIPKEAWNGRKHATLLAEHDAAWHAASCRKAYHILCSVCLFVQNIMQQGMPQQPIAPQLQGMP